MGAASGRQYVALLIDPTTGEIEAYGPTDEPDAVVLAAELQTALAADAELCEIGVLVLPLQPTAARRVAAQDISAAGGARRGRIAWPDFRGRSGLIRRCGSRMRLGPRGRGQS
jgi:hypothetical protein